MVEAQDVAVAVSRAVEIFSSGGYEVRKNK